MCLDLVCLNRLACGAIIERIMERHRYGDDCRGACRRPRLEVVGCEETQTPCFGCICSGTWVRAEDQDGRCIWWNRDPSAPRNEWCRGKGILGAEEAELLWRSLEGRPEMRSGAAWARWQAQERRDVWRDDQEWHYQEVRRPGEQQSTSIWVRRQRSDRRNDSEPHRPESNIRLLGSSTTEEQEEEWEQWPGVEFQREQSRSSQQLLLEAHGNPPPPYSPPRSPEAR